MAGSKDKLVAVQYVGTKPLAVDNVARSGKFWHGRGSVQKVTEVQAKRLCLHPDQWRRDDGSALPTEDERAAAVAAVKLPRSVMSLDAPLLEEMDPHELVTFASRKMGLDLDPGLSESVLRQRIKEHEINARLDDEFERNNATTEAAREGA